MSLEGGLLLFFLPLSISIGLAWLFSRPASRFYLLDHPNERSLHTRPTPRTGGLAIVIAGYLSAVMAQACCLGSVPGLVWIAAAGLLVAAVSYVDDQGGLAIRYRLVSHFIAAVVIMVGGDLTMPGLSQIDLGLRVTAWLITPLFIVWMINLYNFMDGMDGFAGGMATTGFGVFAAMGWAAGHNTFFGMSMIVAASAAGFLVFNFPPARIFMGDVGSSTLGLMVAAFSLWGAGEGVFPVWIAILVFSPFIADATLTLLRRLWRGEKVWQAHKTHCYQRLVQAGWGHRKTVLFEYVIMLGCGTTALYAVDAPRGLQIVILSGWTLFYLLFFFLVSRLGGRRDHPKAS